MTAEIADGWLPFGLRKRNAAKMMGWVEAGLNRAGKRLEDFEIQGGVSVEITDDVIGCPPCGQHGVHAAVGGDHDAGPVAHGIELLR